MARQGGRCSPNRGYHVGLHATVVTLELQQPSEVGELPEDWRFVTDDCPQPLNTGTMTRILSAETADNPTGQ